MDKDTSKVKKKVLDNDFNLENIYEKNFIEPRQFYTDFKNEDHYNKIRILFEEELKKENEYKERNLKEQLKVFLKTDFKNDFYIDFSTKDEDTSNEEIIKKLSKSYKSGKLALVLGAGVSLNYGLPSWSILLQELMVTTIEKDQRASNALSKLFTELFAPNPVIVGRYLQKYYDEKKIPFEDAVRKVLYSGINKNKTSPIMDEIVKFCVAAGKSPNLDSIISYNFDDLLEQHLLKTKVEIPFRPIFGTGMNPEPEELPIYHVHGYLPEEGDLSSDNLITFGENVYHKQYNDIYSWNNIVQINKFRDNTCLFIGSSLTDPNIRRLLDVARIQKGDKKEYHYIFRKRYETKEIELKLKKILEENKILLNDKNRAELNFNETVNFLIKTIENFEENDSSSFGVKTIWINDFDLDIPLILRKIRQIKNS